MPSFMRRMPAIFVVGFCSFALTALATASQDFAGDTPPEPAAVADVIEDGVIMPPNVDDNAWQDGAVESEPIGIGTFSGAGEALDYDGCVIGDGCVTPRCPKRCQCANCQIKAGGDPYNRLIPQSGPIRVRGWVDGGILGNTSNPDSHFNGPYNATEVDNGQLNQFYLIADRPMAADGSWTYGGRFDMLYGGDYNLAQSTGLEVSPNGTPRWNSNEFDGLALPQAYAEIGTKYTSVKGGHFYTVVGYEGVQSPTNFFYSHAYSYMFAGPFTNWGGMLNAVRGNWQLQAGIVNGWNNLVQQQNHGNFLGNLRYSGKSWWSSLAVITGDEFSNPGNLPTVTNAYTNRTRYSFIVDLQPTSRLEYVFHQWLGSQAQGAPGGGTALWYGIDQYLYYKLADKWRLGTRIEWFRDQSGTRVGLTEQSNPNKVPLPGNYASWTWGLNWTPMNNVMLRPEIRWDSYRGPAKPFDDGLRTYQFLVGMDAILQF
jgi:hypothetical protein